MGWGEGEIYSWLLCVSLSARGDEHPRNATACERAERVESRMAREGEREGISEAKELDCQGLWEVWEHFRIRLYELTYVEVFLDVSVE